MSNITNAPTPPTPAPTTTMAPTTQTTTLTPTSSPTISFPSTSGPTPSPTNSTFVEIIKLPSYKSSDPADVLFLAITIILLFIVTISCIRSIHKTKNKRKMIENELKRELSLNEESGDDEIRVATKRDYSR